MATLETTSQRRTRPQWRQQLVQAERGLACGLRGGYAFAAHFFGAAIVLTAGFVFGLTWSQWSNVLLCLTVVFTAEMFHQAFRKLHSGTDPARSPAVDQACGIAQAAVLVASIGSGTIILLQFALRLSALWN